MQINEYVCCPQCKQDLCSKENGLSCERCGLEYETESGIPILANLQELPPHLRGQIKYFGKEGVTNISDYTLDAWQARYVSRFNDNFKDVAGKVIIDCGTGSGYMSIELAKAGAFVISCDLTLRNLVRLKAIAKKLGLENIIFVCCNAEELPIKTGIVDYFISNAVLEHLPKEAEAIAEINRICKKDSGMMIALPIKYSYIFPPFLPLHYFQDKMIGHLRRYDGMDIKNKFASWQRVRVYYTGHIKKVFKVIANRIFEMFDYGKIEAEDQKKELDSKWSSVIIAFLIRN